MSRRRLLACGALLLLVVASGCLGLLDGGDGVDPSAVDQRVEGRLASIDTVEMTVVQTVSRNNTTRTMRAHVVYQRPNRVNMTFQNESLPWTHAVSNGSVTWQYGGQREEVRRSDDPMFGNITDLFAGLGQLDANATFEGNETFAGEDAVKLSYPVADTKVSLLLAGGEQTSQLSSTAANGTVRTKVWLDTDTWLPRKTKMVYPAYEHNRTVTLRFEDVEINGEVPEGAFRYDPPSDAEVVPGDQSAFRPPPENTTDYDSRAATVDAADAPVPDPAVPERFGFVRGSVMTGDHLDGVELTYEAEDRTLEVVVLRDHRPIFDQGESVSLDGTDALFVDLGPARVVQWECGEYRYLVSTDGSHETALSVAQSVGC